MSRPLRDIPKYKGISANQISAGLQELWSQAEDIDGPYSDRAILDAAADFIEAHAIPKTFDPHDPDLDADDLAYLYARGSRPDFSKDTIKRQQEQIETLNKDLARANAAADAWHRECVERRSTRA